jgi:hypothetical protein
VRNVADFPLTSLYNEIENVSHYPSVAFLFSINQKGNLPDIPFLLDVSADLYSLVSPGPCVGAIAFQRKSPTDRVHRVRDAHAIHCRRVA